MRRRIEHPVDPPGLPPLRSVLDIQRSDWSKFRLLKLSCKHDKLMRIRGGLLPERTRCWRCKRS